MDAIGALQQVIIFLAVQMHYAHKNFKTIASNGSTGTLNQSQVNSNYDQSYRSVMNRLCKDCDNFALAKRKEF